MGRLTRLVSLITALILMATAVVLAASAPARASSGPASTPPAVSLASTEPASAMSTGFRTTKDLLNVRVPSVCGHKSGRLKNGKLPGIKPINGFVRLDRSRSKVGAIAPGASKGAVAVLYCNAGGTSWSSFVLFYNSKRQMIGRYDTTAFGPRTDVHSVRRTAKKTTAYVQGVKLSGEGLCCGTGTGRVSFTWSKAQRKMVPGKRFLYSERAKAQMLINAINRRDRRGALRHGSSQAVNELWHARAAAGRNLVLNPTCFRSNRVTGRDCIAYAPDTGFWGIYVRMTHRKGAIGWFAARADWFSSD